MRVVSIVEKVFSMEELLKNVPSRRITDELGRELRSVKENQEKMNQKLSDLDSRGFSDGTCAQGSDASIGECFS